MGGQSHRHPASCGWKCAYQAGENHATVTVLFHLEGEDNARVLEAGRNARLVAYGGLVNKDTRTVPAIRN
jgi:hypothetical protein